MNEENKILFCVVNLFVITSKLWCLESKLKTRLHWLLVCLTSMVKQSLSINY